MDSTPFKAVFFTQTCCVIRLKKITNNALYLGFLIQIWIASELISIMS